jgi:hypothetical protein
MTADKFLLLNHYTDVLCSNIIKTWFKPEYFPYPFQSAMTADKFLLLNHYRDVLCSNIIKM